MKKRTVCLMVAALAAGTLCGCSGSEKPAETTVASGAQSEAAKEDEGKSRRLQRKRLFIRQVRLQFTEQDSLSI